MEHNYEYMEYIIFYTEDADGTARFSKWIKKSQYIRKKKLKKIKKLMKKNE